MVSYKNVLFAVAFIAAFPVDLAAVMLRCQSCEQKMAIKQSIKDALAAAMAAAKPVMKDQEMQDILDKCGCGKPKPKPSRADSAEEQDCDEEECAEAVRRCVDENAALCFISQQLEDIEDMNKACCKTIHHIKKELKEQGEDAEKCCRKIRHELDEIEDLIISQTDQLATCCSVIETNIGDLCASSVIDIPNPASIVDIVDSSCLDMLTWLKSIYAVVAQIYFCTCNL